MGKWENDYSKKGDVFMKKRLICPSMMCADFSVLKKEVTELEEAGADIIVETPEEILRY